MGAVHGTGNPLAKCRNRLLYRDYNVQEVADIAVGFQRVAQLDIRVNNVVILASFAFALQVTGIFQVGDNTLHGALGYANGQGHFAQGLLGVTRQADKYMRMVREERPMVVIRHDDNGDYKSGYFKQETLFTKKIAFNACIFNIRQHFRE